MLNKLFVLDLMNFMKNACFRDKILCIEFENE